MHQFPLSNKDEFPTENLIFSHIGKSRRLWELLFEYIRQDLPDCTWQWRYYNDGKRWLLKVSRKTKTIFWLSIVPGSFRTTFYFPARAAAAIRKSTLPDELKHQFTAGRNIGAIRGITISFRRKRDVEDAKRLIELKTAFR